jgi:succinyl-CoA synthetase alpha subunit
MAILINKNTKLIVQGITGHHGSFHAELMKEYGTQIVAGVTPDKEGMKIAGIKVYNNVKDALTFHNADWSIIFVPANHASEAAKEAFDNDLNVVLITEGMPIHDTIKLTNIAREKNLYLIGPNCPGVISPGECKAGIMPGNIFKKGRIGVVSRSGTLTYEVVKAISNAGFGQSTVVGIGGDPINGLNFIEALTLFEKDENTEKIVLIGEIGGDLEEKAAGFIKNNISKPVVAYVVGKTAPKEKTMGHAGAIILGDSGTFGSKVKAFEDAGVKIASLPSEVPTLL